MQTPSEQSAGSASSAGLAGSAGPTDPLEQMAEEVFLLNVETWRRRVASKQLGPIELSESQYLTLDTLMHAAAAPSVGEIQRTIGVLPAQMSRIIRSLEYGFEQPLIHCELNQSDKRKIDVHLTPDGKRIFEEFRTLRLGRTVRILKNLSDQDRDDFVRICGRIRELHRTLPPERESDKSPS